MATRAKNLQGYITEVTEQAGTDGAVGKYLGYADGSRIGIWKAGKGRPDELACVKLARWSGDNPLTILRFAGYSELADLLEGIVAPPSSVQLTAMRPVLQSLQTLIDAALTISGGKE